MSRPKSYPFLALVCLALLCGCSNPEKKVVGLWTGSGEIATPKTGNAEIDSRAPKTVPIGCNLDMKEDKTYDESLQGYEIVGTWSLSGDNITLTPRTINGMGVDAAKKKYDEEKAKFNVTMDLPGLNGPEQATADTNAQPPILTVQLFSSPIKLHKAQDVGGA